MNEAMHPSDNTREAKMHPDFMQLSRYALNEASTAERSQLEPHLQVCASCRALVEETAMVERGLRQLLPPAGGPHRSCPSASEWAGFIEDTVTSRERAVLNQHLLTCDECLDRVLSGKRMIRGGVPEFALEQAQSLASAPPRKRHGASWLLGSLSISRWAAVGYSTAMVALLVLFLRGVYVRPRVPPIIPSPPQPEAQQLWDQLAALKPEDHRATLLAVTPGLRQSLTAYQENPKREEEHRLLEQLQKLEPALPVHQITLVHLKGSLTGRSGGWVVLQWKGSSLDIVPLVAATNKRQDK